MDLALAVRMMVRHPALSAIAVFGITVGIAMSATMFTLVGEQLNPSALPLPDGRRIVALQQWDSASSCHAAARRAGYRRLARADLDGAPPRRLPHADAKSHRPARCPPACGSRRSVGGRTRRRGCGAGDGSRPPFRGRAPGRRALHGRRRDARGVRVPNQPRLLDPPATGRRDSAERRRAVVDGVRATGRWRHAGECAGRTHGHRRAGASVVIRNQPAPAAPRRCLRGAVLRDGAAGQQDCAAARALLHQPPSGGHLHQRRGAGLRTDGGAPCRVRRTHRARGVPRPHRGADVHRGAGAGRTRRPRRRVARGRGARIHPRQYRAIEQRIATSGTVRAITFSSFAPGSEPAMVVRSDVGETDTRVEVNRVAVNFFDTFGKRILTGRNFANADAEPLARSVIVSRAFEQAMPEGAAALGSRIRLGTDDEWARAISGLGADWYQIVGIVEDFPPPPPGTESPDARVYRAVTPDATSSLMLALHVPASDMEPWSTRLRRIAAGLDPTLQLTQVTPMDIPLREGQRNARLLAGVMATLALSVLLLSAAGMYAMTSFAVTQRRREIGIRLALDAGARKILWTIFSRAATQLLLRAALGTGVALFLNQAADGSMLASNATVAITVVVLLITGAGLLAALGPAREGLRIEPIEALRERAR